MTTEAKITAGEKTEAKASADLLGVDKVLGELESMLKPYNKVLPEETVTLVRKYLGPFGFLTQEMFDWLKSNLDLTEHLLMLCELLDENTLLKNPANIQKVILCLTRSPQNLFLLLKVLKLRSDNNDQNAQNLFDQLVTAPLYSLWQPPCSDIPSFYPSITPTLACTESPTFSGQLAKGKAAKVAFNLMLGSALETMPGPLVSIIITYTPYGSADEENSQIIQNLIKEYEQAVSDSEEASAIMADIERCAYEACVNNWPGGLEIAYESNLLSFPCQVEDGSLLTTAVERGSVECILVILEQASFKGRVDKELEFGGEDDCALNKAYTKKDLIALFILLKFGDTPCETMDYYSTPLLVLAAEAFIKNPKENTQVFLMFLYSPGLWRFYSSYQDNPSWMDSIQKAVQKLYELLPALTMVQAPAASVGFSYAAAVGDIKDSPANASGNAGARPQ